MIDFEESPDEAGGDDEAELEESNGDEMFFMEESGLIDGRMDGKEG